jgi:uncharacterized protein
MSVSALVARALATCRAGVRLLPRRPVPGMSVVEMIIRDLPAAFEGYQIVALADFHHPVGGDLTWLERTVDAVNTTSPDLIALLGDYGESFKRARSLSRHWYREALPELTPSLSRLRARDGIVAVLGNHDYYGDADAVIAWLSQLHVDVLVNRQHRVVRGEHTLRVAGLDDVFEGRLDPTVGCDVALRDPTVVLSHNPDGVLYFHPTLRVDGVIAGHTHGGQIVIPWYGAPLTMTAICGRRSASGWVPNSRTALYVTRGLGEQLPLPIRLNCPREALLLRLTAGSQQPA